MLHDHCFTCHVSPVVFSCLDIPFFKYCYRINSDWPNMPIFPISMVALRDIRPDPLGLPGNIFGIATVILLIGLMPFLSSYQQCRGTEDNR